MKVLILGLPRTGTQSLADALIYLGITPVYHMREVAKSSHQDLWIRAIADNLPPFSSPTQPPSNPWTREQWDELLGSYEAVSDFPPALFPASLAEAYPDCPIILSTRSFESWNASMRDTLIHMHLHRDPAAKSPMAGLANAYHSACWDDDFEKNGKECFERHHAQVRALATGGRRFLEYRPGDGWGPVCEFLGIKEIPEIPFPRSDDWVEYKKKVERERREEKEGTGVIESSK
ncbi:uncharacterized protein CTRU02_204969 [Colletotrichum truncatum]|uniref:Uncharacterized protein n=1 Tax=Colletotrichum truncatum TaxID=5467 RepID=A0ACC3Z2P0_COLTU|nr:uncharacterized protein CTRU02_06200 [Colletotrichum truncatum]KAF6793328.1 hypothetical protein CTRU02_06200 [Colletotrichum truncatum]